MTADIDVHSAKQSYSIFEIEDGMQSDCRDEQFWKASGQILRSLDGDSNVTVDIDSHLLKQLGPIVSSEDGRQIDCRAEQ
jgi:hypothetical protein